MLSFNRQTFVMVGCLLLLYISWGSTFIGNKMALEYFPGFLFTGLRFTIAGGLLLAYTFIRREQSRISWADIKLVLFNGIFLVVAGSGFVAKAQEFQVPSGMAAILFGAAPVWLVLGQWLLWGGKKPTLVQAVGLCLGFAALIALNIHQGIGGDASILGLILILVSTFAWVYGSHFSQQHKNDNSLSLIRSTGLLLFVGGLESLALGMTLGERVDLFALPPAAFLSLAHLTLFSSIIAYTTYIWLLFNARAIVAISYEYVVPGVAVVLGALIANEPIDAFIIVTSCVMLFSVFLITSHDRK